MCSELFLDLGLLAEVDRVEELLRLRVRLLGDPHRGRDERARWLGRREDPQRAVDVLVVGSVGLERHLATLVAVELDRLLRDDLALDVGERLIARAVERTDRKSTRLNSS